MRWTTWVRLSSPQDPQLLSETALGYLDARRHVNKMCMAANIPLIESGTAGYLGQVQPILKVSAFTPSLFAGVPALSH